MNTIPCFGISTRRACFRLREKYLLVVAVLVVCLLCYSGFVFLPTGEQGTGVRKSVDKLGGSGMPLETRSGRLQNVLDRLPNAEQLVLPPPNIGTNRSSYVEVMKHEQRGQIDPHHVDDMQRLQEKIEADERRAQIQEPRSLDGKGEAAVRQFGVTQAREEVEDLESVEAKRAAIKQMMIHAWDGYAKYAWGANELKPISKTAHSGSVFGGGKLGASIVDGMDTLYIMGLFDRFDNAKKWVELSFDIKGVRGELSVFETNIRFIGGMLTCYALTKDKMFLNRAKEITDALLPAFNTPTGIPYALINIQTQSSHNWGWASGGASILSEFGTLSLEFNYLSDMTGDPIYRLKIDKILEFLDNADKPDGLYPNYLNPKTGKWGSRHTSIGALGDSYYEYLLKNWLISGKTDKRSKRMYDETVKAMERQLFQKSGKGLLYIAEMRGNRLDAKMDHLACFSAGMFALQAVNEANESDRNHYMDTAKQLGHTCHLSYSQTETHLGPEAFRFTNDFEAKAINNREKHYILRPEVIEGFFYLWRLTKEQKWRNYAWDAAQAIEKYCKAEAGYSGIRNVYDRDPAKDDVQQSYFLAETLKYLYLTFSPDEVMPLDQWVFNTEAHPLPVRMPSDKAEQDVFTKDPNGI